MKRDARAAATGTALATLSHSLTRLLILVVLASTVSAQCWLGSWEPPFDDDPPRTQPTPGPAGDPLVGWPADYKFNATHAHLIPKGAHQGHVMVSDHYKYPGHPSSEKRVIRYAIIDPVSKTFWRHIYALPDYQGDLFCAGHAWTKDGNLFLAGGTGCHGPGPLQISPCQGWEGAKLAFVWEPPRVSEVGHPGRWYRAPDLQSHRWYPSVIALSSQVVGTNSVDPMLVPGGTHNGTPVNSYQVWLDTPPQAGAGQWHDPLQNGVVQWNGPLAQQVDSRLDNYPRMHLLSNAFTATAGMAIGSDRLNHFAVAGGWLNDQFWMLTHPRSYGSSVLFPVSPGGVNKDHILSIAGRDWVTGTIADSVEMSVASAANSPAYHWMAGTIAPLTHKRWLCNAVLLADGNPLVVGGDKATDTNWCAVEPALVPELLDQNTLSWMSLTPGTIIRNYHSTALLLPSGKVWTGGGESRRFQAGAYPPPPPPCLNLPVTGAADYQIFVPPYLNCIPIRPVIVTPAVPDDGIPWLRGTTQTIQYSLPEGTLLSIAKVTLLRAGSVTHHNDNNQRCLQLEFTVVPEVTPAALQITVPAATVPNVGLLPRGYYMLFLISNEGTPSEARWIKVT